MRCHVIVLGSQLDPPHLFLLTLMLQQQAVTVAEPPVAGARQEPVVKAEPVPPGKYDSGYSSQV